MNQQEALDLHESIKEKALFGRYIAPEKVIEITTKLPSLFAIKTVGFSVDNRPIQTVTFGTGKTKILMWSQMHGNESTTTKSIFDFFNFFQSNIAADFQKIVLEKCTFCILPMLNPDGSKMWTRENANGVDLNRDAKNLSQPESKILNKIFDNFDPDYCFNLHGQRTIYGFENTGKPSILSFLAPAAEVTRSFTFSRKRSASVISHIHATLQSELPGQIGLYDDAYNGDCVGDTFQSSGVATVLFEAGHYPNDYDREITRKFIFIALLAGVEATVMDLDYSIDDYKSIPKHQKCFCDVHRVKDEEVHRYQYTEVLENESISFVPEQLTEALSSGLFAHESQKK